MEMETERQREREMKRDEEEKRGSERQRQKQTGRQRQRQSRKEGEIKRERYNMYSSHSLNISSTPGHLINEHNTNLQNIVSCRLQYTLHRHIMHKRGGR